jgi:protein SCO1/2
MPSVIERLRALLRPFPRRAATLLVLGAIVAAPAGAADPSPYSAEQALAYSQAALGRQIGSHALLDRQGRTVELARYRGRPLIVSMIYTSCYHTCPMLTQNLAQTVRLARDALGEGSFSVITVGFDAPVDTPERMQAYAREQGIDIADWEFLAGDAKSIEQLSVDLGFIFFASPKGFDHLAQTTVLDADGRVYRQIYGNDFRAPQVVEPLKELLFGGGPRLPVSVSGWMDRIRLFCTIYDPATDRYRFDYSILVTIVSGVISFGAVLVFLLNARRGGRPTGPAH